MAVVLSSEENSYFSSSNLRRSHSQPKFVTKHTGFHKSASTSRMGDVYQNAKTYEDSTPSSAPSSPRTIQAESSSDLSYTSTPASNFSLSSDCDDDDDEHDIKTQRSSPDKIYAPLYDDPGHTNELENLETPPSSRTGDSHTTSTYTSRPESPEIVERAEDDIAIKAIPSRHVDYLSHDWREEDIWSSWKLIVSRRGDYTNSARLENASWRTWMKSKNKLRTISPETLNWLKDCDVTWLYGPLQTGTANLDPTHTDCSSARLSKNHSLVNRKPILKKRSVSELMLQKSLSASSLLKQAAAAVQAQQGEGGRRLGRRPGLDRSATDIVMFALPSGAMSRSGTSQLSSTASSGLGSPSGERKHIHFNEQVEQCIAVDVKGDDDDEDLDMPRFLSYDSDSDDGAIMMKRTKVTKRRPILSKINGSSTPNGGESKTIAMLPSTTLKYMEDTPEPGETAMRHSVSRSPALSPSSSQETLRPSKKSGKLFIDDDEDEDDEQELDGSSFPGRWSPSRMGEASSEFLGSLHRSSSSGSLTAEPAGMRRTASGMFMPYDEGDTGLANEGLFGRVIDTVNTARDIAHVIWNVGWRK